MVKILSKTAKELVLEKFVFTDEKSYEYYNKLSTEFIKNYLSTATSTDISCDTTVPFRKLYKYLSKLDSTLETYFQFSADKCGVDNMSKFMQDLNLDMNDLNQQLEDFPLGRDGWNEVQKVGGEVFRGYTVASRDKKLVCSFASKYCGSGDFHYFGVTGEGGAVLAAFKIFLEQGYYSGLSWAGRDYI